MEETLAKDIHLTQDEVAPAAAAVKARFTSCLTAALTAAT